MRGVLVIVFLGALSACHTQAPRVRCDAKLQPINAPAQIEKGGVVRRATP